MGYITTLNSKGREVMACEAGYEGCTSYPCRAHYCPHGWCQKYYFCANCWAKLRQTWRGEHEKCRENMMAAVTK